MSMSIAGENGTCPCRRDQAVRLRTPGQREASRQQKIRDKFVYDVGDEVPTGTTPRCARMARKHKGA